MSTEKESCGPFGAYGSDNEDHDLIPGQSMWDLWWTNWNWDRFSPVNSIPPVLHYMEKRKN